VWQALNNSHFQLTVWAANGGCPSYFIPALLRPRAFFACAALHLACSHKGSRPGTGSGDSGNLLEEGFRVQLLPTKKYSPDEIPQAGEAEQRPGSPARRVNSRGIADGPMQVHGFMVHGARLEFSKLRLQDPISPAPATTTAGGAAQATAAVGATTAPAPSQYSVRLPVLQVRLAPASSLPAPSAVAPPATSVQDTTDIECPVLVAAMPSEAANRDEALRRWAPPKAAQGDLTVVTGIILSTEVCAPSVRFRSGPAGPCLYRRTQCKAHF
jgi:hypothetical protein